MLRGPAPIPTTQKPGDSLNTPLPPESPIHAHTHLALDESHLRKLALQVCGQQTQVGLCLPLGRQLVHPSPLPSCRESTLHLGVYNPLTMHMHMEHPQDKGAGAGASGQHRRAPAYPKEGAWSICPGWAAEPAG